MKIKNKKRYEKIIKKRFIFHPRTVKLFMKQIELFCLAEEKYHISKSKYKIGDEVVLRKGTFMHGTRKGIQGLDLIVKDGFLSSDLYTKTRKQKTPWCTSMWNIQSDIKLKDYINLYSGVTIQYSYLDGHKETKLIPYNQINQEIEGSRNSSFWMWNAEQTKEIRFLPSLAKDENQIGFIINTDNEYANKMVQNDIFNLKFDKKILKTFIERWFREKYIYTKRDDFTTNRESAIIFGIPSCFVEGILVGRIIEKKINVLNEIKDKFPNCYICNLDGKVIM